MVRSTKKHIAIIMALLLVAFYLIGCGSSTPSPTATADTFLKAFKSQDSGSMSNVYGGPEIDLIDSVSQGDLEKETGLNAVFEEQMLPKMLDFDYELSNEQIDGDKAKVDVKIKTYKFGEAFTSFFSEYLPQMFVLALGNASAEEIDALGETMLREKLSALSEKSYEKTAELTMTMKDGKWIVDELEDEGDFIDTISGGLVTSLKTISDAFSEFGEEPTQSSEQTESASKEPVLPLEIKEYGYSVHGDYLYYSVCLHNPNEKYYIEFPTFRITARDAGGVLLGTEDQVLHSIYPQEDVWYAFLGFEVEEEPASVTVEALTPEDWNVSDVSKAKHPDYIPLSVINYAKRGDKIVGEIQNDNDYEISQVVLSVVYRDNDGKLLGGDGTFVDDLPAKGTAPFEMNMYHAFSDNFELYARSWD